MNTSVVKKQHDWSKDTDSIQHACTYYSSCKTSAKNSTKYMLILKLDVKFDKYNMKFKNFENGGKVILIQLNSKFHSKTFG